MKSGTSSAVAFGQVLQLVRKYLDKNQAEVALTVVPSLSVSAISMAESGARPLKTEEMVKRYAVAFDLDGDDLVELWWACQGIVGVEDWNSERIDWRWWRRLLPRSVEVEEMCRKIAKEAKGLWTPNANFHAPDQHEFALAEAIRDILRRLLGDVWSINLLPKIGLAEPVEGYWASIEIHLQARRRNDSDGESRPFEQIIICPVPKVQPKWRGEEKRPVDQVLSPDVAWILTAVERMSVKERSAVAGFIHGLREAPSVFSDFSD